MKFDLTQDEVQLLHFMVEQPEILIVNGRKGQTQKGEMIPIGVAYPVDDKPAARKNFLRLRQWMQKRVYTRKTSGEGSAKTMTFEMLPVTVSLKQAGLDFLLDVVEHYKTTCSVMPWVAPWTHLDYKLRNNGAKLEVDDFEDDEVV